jgi:hypothetical protein
MPCAPLLNSLLTERLTMKLDGAAKMKHEPVRAPQRELVISFPRANPLAAETLRERFASTILTFNRSELREIFHEIVKTSDLSVSPDKFLRTMADAPGRILIQRVSQDQILSSADTLSRKIRKSCSRMGTNSDKPGVENARRPVNTRNTGKVHRPSGAANQVRVPLSFPKSSSPSKAVLAHNTASRSSVRMAVVPLTRETGNVFPNWTS